MKISAFVLALTLAACSHAGVIYDTLGPGNDFNRSISLSVDNTQSVATPFSVSSAGLLTSVDIALSQSDADYAISLREGGAVAPGTALYTWSVTAGADGVFSLAPVGTVNVPVGDYYIVAENAGNIGGWNWNTVGHVGPFSHTSNGVWYTSRDTTGAMRIDVAPVPEPASLAALGLGAATLLRRRKKA